MDNLGRRSYPYLNPYEPSSSSYSLAAVCLAHYHGNIDTIQGIQIRTPTKPMKFVEPGICIDDDTPAAVIFDALPTQRPHDSGLLGTASLGPVQPEKSAEDDSSPAVTQCWQKILANVGDPAQTLTCNSPENSFLNSSNPLLPPTRSYRRKKATARGGSLDREAGRMCIGNDHREAGRKCIGNDHREAGRKCIGNDHVHKLVERQRRNKMKALCSTLISLLPKEYQKTKHTLSDKLLEAIKHVRHLQDKLIELEQKRDELNLSATVKPFSNSSYVHKNLQVSQVRPSNVRDKFQTIRVSKFGPGIQVTVNTFNNQIDFSSLLMVLEEAGVEVVSATVSAINDRAFYSIHSKLSDFRHFDSALLHGRIDQLMNGNLPSNSMIK